MCTVSPLCTANLRMSSLGLCGLKVKDTSPMPSLAHAPLDNEYKEPCSPKISVTRVRLLRTSTLTCDASCSNFATGLFGSLCFDIFSHVQRLLAFGASLMLVGLSTLAGKVFAEKPLSRSVLEHYCFRLINLSKEASCMI